MEAQITCVLCNSLGSKDVNLLSNTHEVKRIHALIHFEQLKSLDNAITEDEILQRCFMIRQPQVERPATKSECRRSLLDLCKSLCEHQSKSDMATCNLCGVAIPIKQKRCMIDHACAHLEVKLFNCRHCKCSSSIDRVIRKHFRRAHKTEPTNEDFEDKTVEYFEDIYNRIKRCFSTNFPRASGLQRQFVISKGSGDKNKQSVLQLCRSIFIQRAKPESVECNLCGLQFSLRKLCHNAKKMYQHAATHMEVKLFTCRHCEHSFSSKWTMTRHLKRAHQIVDHTCADYDDRSGNLHSDYKNMIARCFSGDQVKLEAHSTKENSRIMAETTVRFLATGSKLAIERHLFCNRLIKKMIDHDGKVKCATCSKHLVIIRCSGHTSIKRALFHVEMHLQKPLYRCKVCKIPFTTQPAVAGHLRRKHALGMTKNYECVADEFHEEFMAMLTKCYAAEG